jgi:hypothetical protein
VTVQSQNLSSFAPALYVFNSSLGIVTSAVTPTAYGSKLSVSVPVSAGQKYYIKVLAGGSYGQVGAYGLELNFGTQSQAPIPPPNTVVAQQPSVGGGSTPDAEWNTIGNLAGWAIAMNVTQTGNGTNNGGTFNPPGQAPKAGAVTVSSAAVTVSTSTSSNQSAGAATATVATSTPGGLVLQALDVSLSEWNGDPGRLTGSLITNESAT